MTSLFVNAGLLGGLALVGLPVLIHLINLLRQRRIPWAAMEFLLVSQKKNRTWVRLKEWLLLLLRMIAVAAAVLILAQPLADGRTLLNLFGRRTEHLVLLDDSFSMGDRWSGSTAFERAKQAIARIGDQAAQDPTVQDFTVLRFSQAETAAGPRPDLLQELVTIEFGERLQERLAGLVPSALDVGPRGALEGVAKLLGKSDDRRQIVYIVSDFRAKEWEQPGDLVNLLSAVQQTPAELKFVWCADAARPNLAITHLGLDGGIVAAGIPLALRVEVANYGPDLVRDVAVHLEEDGVGRSAIRFDEIPPFETAVQRFPVQFATAGEHVVNARLDDDVVSQDNQRWTVLDLPLSNPVLLVDGGERAADAFFLSTVFAPGGSVRTGIDPEVHPASWLNNNPLERFSAIYLLNVERLDDAGLAALEKYLQGGGGVAFFLGDKVSAQFYNDRLYRDGTGPFPLPLLTATDLLVDRLDKAADLEVLAPDHPMFRVFAGERNSFLNLVTIMRFWAAPRGWQPAAESGTQVVARLRNGSPFTVEKRWESGRVVAVTSTAAPMWNNWGQENPSFPVTMLELQAHLAAARWQRPARLAGSPIELRVSPEQFQRRVRYVPPPASRIESAAGDLVDAADQLVAQFPDTSAAGLYELQLTTSNDTPELRKFALNVASEEGNLTLIDPQQMVARLPGVAFETLRAEQFVLSAQDGGRSNLSELILYALVLLLIGEQALAYSASYHPAPVAGGSRS